MTLLSPRLILIGIASRRICKKSLLLLPIWSIAPKSKCYIYLYLGFLVTTNDIITKVFVIKAVA